MKKNIHQAPHEFAGSTEGEMESSIFLYKIQSGNFKFPNQYRSRDLNPL